MAKVICILCLMLSPADFIEKKFFLERVKEGERERKRILSRFHAQCGAQCQAQSQL